MGDVVEISSKATTPADVLAVLTPDAERMRAVVVVALLDDGSWHVRHSTTQQSIVDSAAVQLLRHLTRGE